MKYLKIENNKGFYCLGEEHPEWIELDQINKEHLLNLLSAASISDEFEMDEYKDELLRNPAHNIIYKNIYNKFKDFIGNRTRFKDSVESMYKSSIEKYKL